MNCRYRFIFYVVLSLLPLLSYGQKEEGEVLSLSGKYLDKLIPHANDSIVVLMADTLFDIAKKEGDKKRQAIALSYKMDYYYKNEIQDIFIENAEKVREFSEANGQLTYYYFAWNRMITSYLRDNRLNIALQEMELMQKDAIDRDYYPGQIDALKLMALLYNLRGMDDEMCEAHRKIIELVEKAPADVDIPNLHTNYLNYAVSLMSINKLDDEILDVLKKAEESTVHESQKTTIYLCYSNYYYKIGDMRKSEEYLRLVKDSDYLANVRSNSSTIAEIESGLALSRGDYQSALEFLDSADFTFYNRIVLWGKYIGIYQAMGDYKKVSQYYKLLYQYTDSMRKADLRSDLSEMVVLLEVNKMKAEKDSVELKTKNKMLNYLYIVLAFLLVAFVVLSWMTVRSLRLNKKLKVSEKIKTDFLQSLSHEIRTPLNSLVGFTDLILDTVNEHDMPELKSFSDIVHESSDQIVKMVNDAIDVSGYDDKSYMVATDINACYRLAMDTMRMSIKEGVELWFEPYNHEGTVVVMDRRKVVKILANLIHNAAKFTTQGSITVSVDIVGKKLVYTVTDTGIGIPVASQKIVFEYFTKLDVMSQGLGLGLALSRTLAQSIGGTLIIDESYTQGCRVIFSFPI